MKVHTILDQIDLGSMALPEFQRGYVWNRDQVRGLMHSLYRKHPVGSLLVWVTKSESATARGDGGLAPGVVELLLDGQQRITSLYGIIRGRPPRFFDGNPQAFTGLYFHLETETFEFFLPTKMNGNPLWVSVTDVMKEGTGKAAVRLLAVPELQANANVYINRLSAIDGIKEIDLHVEKVLGENKTVDVVVDIFNRVNSGGTKLSKGDLALAKICAEWPEARTEMKRRLEKWRRAGFQFRLEWLLRNINAITTGEALFHALENVSTEQFKAGLAKAECGVDRILNHVAGRLGLDHDRVLGSHYAFPVIARFLDRRGGNFADHRERDRVLFWYVHTLLWGRYAGSTETVLNQDLEITEELDGAIDRLVVQLRQNRGDLKVTPNDFIGFSRGARFYPLLYMLTRVWHAKDWGSGDELTQHLLGSFNRLHVHHIFPKALLYKHGYKRADVNAVANFTFLTQDTNLEVSDRDPAEYMPVYERKHPGAIASHWIPQDPRLWKLDNYPQFLEERRRLLAAAANAFLETLYGGSLPELAAPASIVERTVPLDDDIDDDDREELEACNAWVVKKSLPPGELYFAATDPLTGTQLAVFDLAWPSGVQEGLTQPVAVLIDEPPETVEAANRLGFRFFTTVKEFKKYVRREVIHAESGGEAAGDNPPTGRVERALGLVKQALDSAELKAALATVGLNLQNTWAVGSNGGYQFTKVSWTVPLPGPGIDGLTLHFETNERLSLQLHVETDPYEPSISKNPVRLEELKPQLALKATLIDRLRSRLLKDGALREAHGITDAHLKAAEKPSTNTAVKFDLGLPENVDAAELGRTFARVFVGVTPVVDEVLANGLNELGLAH